MKLDLPGTVIIQGGKITEREGKVKGKKGKKNIEFVVGEPLVSNLNVQCRSADARDGGNMKKTKIIVCSRIDLI